MTGEMYLRQAIELEERWIREEILYRGKVDQAMKQGYPFAGLAGHADQLAECRKDLQRSFGLIGKVGGNP